MKAIETITGPVSVLNRAGPPSLGQRAGPREGYSGLCPRAVADGGDARLMMSGFPRGSCWGRRSSVRVREPSGSSPSPGRPRWVAAEDEAWDLRGLQVPRCLGSAQATMGYRTWMAPCIQGWMAQR